MTAPDANTRLPAWTLLIGFGGLALVIGAFLPWVTVGTIFSVNGLNAHYGIGTLLAGVVALATALGAGRIYKRKNRETFVSLSALLGLGAVVVAVLAAVFVQRSIADTNGRLSAAESSSPPNSAGSSDSAFAQSLTEMQNSIQNSIAQALQIGTGFGVYLTGLGGVLILAGAGVATPGILEEKRAAKALRDAPPPPHGWETT